MGGDFFLCVRYQMNREMLASSSSPATIAGTMTATIGRDEWEFEVGGGVTTGGATTGGATTLPSS